MSQIWRQSGVTQSLASVGSVIHQNWSKRSRSEDSRLARHFCNNDFNIVHRRGRIHSNVDCLFRRPYDSCEISSPKKEEPQTPHTQEMQRRDPE